MKTVTLSDHECALLAQALADRIIVATEEAQTVPVFRTAERNLAWVEVRTLEALYSTVRP